jgi:hypothetical protein
MMVKRNELRKSCRPISIVAKNAVKGSSAPLGCSRTLWHLGRGRSSEMASATPTARFTSAAKATSTTDRKFPDRSPTVRVYRFTGASTKIYPYTVWPIAEMPPEPAEDSYRLEKPLPVREDSRIEKRSGRSPLSRLDSPGLEL